jgi:polyhydroxybutyrate depolymerase
VDEDFVIKYAKVIWIIIIVLVALAIVSTSTYLLVNRTNGQIESSGRLRKYLLYVPESYDTNTPTPLVISIHGFVQWPAHQQTLSGWNSLAYEHGFIVVYPQGTGFPLRWNTQPTEDKPDAMTEDVQFFSDLIDALSQDYNIDQSRIYANGMSNGGGMTHLLACELSDRIAAIGGVAGAYIHQWEYCHPLRPVPVIAFHGVDDSIVPYDGGPTISRNYKYKFAPVEEWAVNWARHNGCEDKPETIPAMGEVNGVCYTNCDGDVEVVLYTVEGGGHTWPGGDELPKWLTGHTTQDVSATELMWEFFSKYSLNQ